MLYRQIKQRQARRGYQLNVSLLPEGGQVLCLSARCFDTEAESDMAAECTWESAFRDSLWFTRGWTLQELLAPRSVEFFSYDGGRLGDKGTLNQQIQEITAISISALEGAPLSQFSVEERLSWAETRQTTRGEDMTYSLLGIFDVQLPLIYGEGKEHAIKRLKAEIQNLLTGKYMLSCILFGCLLITLCKKPSRPHSTLRLGAAYKAYE